MIISKVLIYQDGWVEATVAKTVVEENLLQRSEDTVEANRIATLDFVPAKKKGFPFLLKDALGEPQSIPLFIP